MNSSSFAYTNITAALARVKERSGASSADDAFLTELLNLSAGKDAQLVVHFRPFIVAARYLEQNKTAQRLAKADGVEFTGLAKPIASLLALQAAYDAAQGLSVPPGFEAVAASAVSQRSGVPRFSSEAYSTQARF